MKEMFRWLMNEESGQGMVEYGVIVALVVVIALALFASTGNGLGASISDMFSNLGSKIEGAVTP